MHGEKHALAIEMSWPTNVTYVTEQGQSITLGSGGKTVVGTFGAHVSKVDAFPKLQRTFTTGQLMLKRVASRPCLEQVCPTILAGGPPEFLSGLSANMGGVY